MVDTCNFSESDDEILGISDELPLVKTYEKWKHCSRGRSKKKSPREHIPILSHKIVQLPSTELIEVSSMNKVTKYQRMKEVKNIKGFIVNVHDAANFDIDLDITPQLHEKYSNVISNQYTYQDIRDDFFKVSDLNVVPEIGTTYRCRLKGIGINQLPSHEYSWKCSQLCVAVKQLIDRTDGWIVCDLFDVDVYQRLLVDITVHTSTGPVNLKDFLLNKMEKEDNPLFYPYSGKRVSVNNLN